METSGDRKNFGFAIREFETEGYDARDRYALYYNNNGVLVRSRGYNYEEAKCDDDAKMKCSAGECKKHDFRDYSYDKDLKKVKEQGKKWK